MTNALAAFARNWIAPPRPVAVRRPSARWAETAAAAPRPAPEGLAARVVAIAGETPTVKSFSLVPEVGSFGYAAGQHLTVVLDLHGRSERRCYSFSTSPLGAHAAAVTVRRVEGGKVSTFLHDCVSVGDTLRVLPPAGTFTLPREDGDERRFVMVAGGVGITPIVSLAETALRRDDRASVLLLCGHREESEIVFRHRLEDLGREFGPRFRLRVALEEAGPEWTGLRGRLGGERVVAEAGADADAYYVCGPEPMMHDVEAALAAVGVAPSRVRTERFAYAEAPVAAAPTTAREIRFAASGRTAIAEPGQTILEAATAAGVALPSSCTMGGCGACKIRKLEGTAISAEPNCLTEGERAEGYVLSCCSYAGDGLVLADY